MIEESTQSNSLFQSTNINNFQVKIGKLPPDSQTRPYDYNLSKQANNNNSRLPPKPVNLTSYLGSRHHLQQQPQHHDKNFNDTFQASHSTINSKDEENSKKSNARNNNTKFVSQRLTQGSFSQQNNKHAFVARAELETVTDLNEEKQIVLRNFLHTFRKTKHSLSNSRFTNLAHFKAAKNNLNTSKLINLNNNIYCQNNPNNNDNLNSKPIQEVLNIMSSNNINIKRDIENSVVEEDEEKLERTIPFERHLKMNRFENFKSFDSKNSLAGDTNKRLDGN